MIGTVVVAVGAFTAIGIGMKKSVKPVESPSSDEVASVSSEDEIATSDQESESDAKTPSSESDSEPDTSEPDTTSLPESTAGTTAPPETTPPATSVSPTTPPPVVYNGNIHTISQAEINDIAARYSLATKSCGTGFGGANTLARSLENELTAVGIQNKVFFCSNGEKKVAFSFQGGYVNGFENQILDILAQKGVRATFYVEKGFANANGAYGNRALIERMLREGHEIGSHSCSDYMVQASAQSLTGMMNDAMELQNYMKSTYGIDMKRYNFFSGQYSVAACAVLERMGYQLDFLSMGYDDWDRTAVKDPNVILPKLQSVLHPGCIYCFHMTNRITVDILPGLIDYCRAQGYEIVMVP